MIYRPPPINEQPFVKLYNWVIIKYKDAFYLSGVTSPCGGEGRFSSNVVATKNELIITNSGRTYSLVGDSCYPRGNGEYVFSIKMNGIPKKDYELIYTANCLLGITNKKD